MRLWILSCIVMCLALALSLAAGADTKAVTDEEYIALFRKHFKPVEVPPLLDTYASVRRYDALYMGKNLEAALADVNNDQGALAWAFSRRLESLNDMYRVTGDTKYLEANLRCIRATLAATDDKRSLKLWTGATVPAWGCDKYAKRGRAIFAVHTGIITAPMFDFLVLAKTEPAFLQSLGKEFDTILEGATDALATHHTQWRYGPGKREGHYIGLDQEEVCENRPLPGNRLAAMGWALWLSWKASGDKVHRDRALALGRYIKNRLTRGKDGAYYWPYWLPGEPVKKRLPRTAVEGEDTSHAGLTMVFPFTLAADGKIFDKGDLERIGKTVTNGFARLGDGILVSRITGTTELPPSYVGNPARWLAIAEVCPEIREPILAFYLNYRSTPNPSELALLMRYAKPE